MLDISPVLTLEDVGKITALVLIVTQLTKMYVVDSKWAPVVALAFSIVGALLYAATYETMGRHLIFPYAVAIGSIWMQATGIYTLVDKGVAVARKAVVNRQVGAAAPLAPGGR